MKGIRDGEVDPAVQAGLREEQFILSERAGLAIARRASALEEFQRAQAALQQATLNSIGALSDAGVGVRDIGRIVGCSGSRVHQLATQHAEKMQPLAVNVGEVSSRLDK